jgi:hypothetical protein
MTKFRRRASERFERTELRGHLALARRFYHRLAGNLAEGGWKENSRAGRRSDWTQ